MARSRNIKPSFFMNEDIIELPYEARSLFIGYWALKNGNQIIKSPIRYKHLRLVKANIEKQLRLREMKAFITRLCEGFLFVIYTRLVDRNLKLVFAFLSSRFQNFFLASLKSSNNSIKMSYINIDKGILKPATMLIKMSFSFAYCHTLFFKVCIYINFILFANDSHLINSNKGGKS